MDSHPIFDRSIQDLQYIAYYIWRKIPKNFLFWKVSHFQIKPTRLKRSILQKRTYTDWFASKSWLFKKKAGYRRTLVLHSSWHPSFFACLFYVFTTVQVWLGRVDCSTVTRLIHEVSFTCTMHCKAFANIRWS